MKNCTDVPSTKATVWRINRKDAVNQVSENLPEIATAGIGNALTKWAKINKQGALNA